MQRSNALSSQLSLPGLDAPSPPFRPALISTSHGTLFGYTLFLAIFPRFTDARQLTGLASELRGQYRLPGKLLLQDRLHITLLKVDGFVDEIPQEKIDAAVAAASRVDCTPFEITFDRAMSFKESNAFVLRCDAKSDEAIARLRQPLAKALRQFGHRPQSSSTPHMTMLYDPQLVAEHPIQPIRWTATRFALILSHAGLGHHQWIKEWNFG
jgi:RNA 2',3'-cyclic 3'-phosphodiesterase